MAQRVEVTEIAQDFDGDAFAPELGPEWVETTREAHTSTCGMARFRFRALPAALSAYAGVPTITLDA